MESQLKSILTFDGKDGKAEAISSPRSLEACLRTGWDPQDLMPRCSVAVVSVYEPLLKLALVVWGRAILAGSQDSTVLYRCTVINRCKLLKPISCFPLADRKSVV